MPYGPVLAPYACAPELTRGRLHREAESETRTVFQRDRDRVIHAGAFRRLKHKTQVFVYHEGDYYRTRLTHSLEVSQIARSVSRALGLNEDLAEALALAHDFGHTPFGHAGEEALAAAMAGYGGFDHNAQSLRILTKLERRYASFDGLNLTWETLEGVVKHNGPLTGPLARPVLTGPRRGAEAPVPLAIQEYVADHDLQLHTYPGAEAQVAALADDIAYNAHDIDDGLRAGLFEVEDLAGVPLVGEAFARVQIAHPGLERARLVHEGVRRIIDVMVNDLIGETRSRLAAGAVRSADQVRDLGGPVAAFGAEVRLADRALKAFLFKRMYRHHRVNRMSSKARRIVTGLFELFLAEPQLLPPEWCDRTEGKEAAGQARVVADYIAGMTDRYALDTHRQLFEPEART